MASVVGLAPTRFGLKGRSLGLLCIHGRNKMQIADFRCRMDGRAFKSAIAFCILHEMVPKVGIAPTSLRLQRSANLP
jgi:hypothetical protein